MKKISKIIFLIVIVFLFFCSLSLIVFPSTLNNIKDISNSKVDSIRFSKEVTSCGLLSNADTTYYLKNNVSSPKICFNITAPNITLNCNGYWINFSYEGTSSNVGEYQYGVYSNQNFTTVKNCNIIEGNSLESFAFGIFLFKHNNTIINNTLNVVSKESVGVYIPGGSHNKISNNIINSNYGVFLENSNHNTVSYNNITCGFLEKASCIGTGFANNDVYFGNNITSGQLGISLVGSKYLNISNNIINASVGVEINREDDFISISNTYITSKKFGIIIGPDGYMKKINLGIKNSQIFSNIGFEFVIIPPSNLTGGYFINVTMPNGSSVRIVDKDHISICKEYIEPNECYYSFAIEKKNASLCENIIEDYGLYYSCMLYFR